MNKSTEMIRVLFFTLILVSCQQADATTSPVVISIEATLTEAPVSMSETTQVPTSELPPYYGAPQPAKIIINDKIYESEIGTTQWITEVRPDGTTVGEIGDAFAIITPTESILATPNLSPILQLPIPINPTELWHILYKVSEQELNSQDGTHGAFRWNPDYKTQAYIEQTSLLLLPEQSLTFFLEPGIYVYEVHAGWGSYTELEADYGFLFEIQE